MFQPRAAVVSGRWEEIVKHTREAMARNRRKAWRWTPPECPAELKALEEQDDGARKHQQETNLRVVLHDNGYTICSG